MNPRRRIPGSSGKKKKSPTKKRGGFKPEVVFIAFYISYLLAFGLGVLYRSNTSAGIGIATIFTVPAFLYIWNLYIKGKEKGRKQAIGVDAENQPPTSVPIRSPSKDDEEEDSGEERKFKADIDQSDE